MAQDISVFIAGSWRKDFEDFRRMVSDAVNDIERLNKRAEKLQIAFDTGGGYAAHKKNTQELIQLQGEYAKATTETAKAITGLDNTKKRVTVTEAQELRNKTALLKAERQYIQEKSRLENALKKEEAAARKQQSAYQQLNAQYRQLADHAKDLAAQYGAEDARAKAAAKSAMDLHKALLKVDQSVGQSQRNVGNYKSQWNGLNHSIQQLVREVPSTINNLEMLPLALSNNIGTLQDSLKQAAAANKQLTAEGKASIPVWKQVIGSIFSFQTLLMAGVAIAVRYGKDIVNWFSGVSKATQEAEKANKKYKESLEDIEKTEAANAAQKIARLNVLVQTVQDTATAEHIRIEAMQTLKKELPDYFGGLDRATMLNGDLTEAVDLASKAILKQGIAMAAYEKYGEAAKAFYLNDKKYNEERERLNTFIGKQTKENQKLIREYMGILDRDNWQYGNKDSENLRYKELQFKLGNKTATELENLWDGMKTAAQAWDGAKTEMNDFLEDYKKTSKEVDNLLGETISKSPHGSVAEMEDKIKLLKEQERVAVVGSKEQIRLTKERKAAEDELNKVLERGKYGREAKHKKPHSMTNEELSAQKQFTREYFEQVEARANAEADGFKTIAEDENVSLKERLTAYESYIDNIEKAKASQLDAEYMATLAQLDKIRQLEAKESAEGQLAPADKTLILRKEALNQTLSTIEQKYLGLSEQMNLKYTHGLEGIYSSYIQKRLGQLEFVYSDIEDRETAAQDELMASYQGGAMTFEQFEKAKKDISIKFNKERAEQTIIFIQKEIDAVKAQGGDITALEKKLNQARKQLREADYQDFISKEEEKARFVKKANDLMWEGGNQFASAVADARQAQFNREIDAREKQIELIDEQLRLEIAAINATSKSKEEANERILQAEAIAFGRRRQQEIEIGKIKRRAAAADKQAAILGATANTIQAVTRAYKDYQWPFNLYVAAIMASLGAAQITAIATKPLPQYEKGTKSKPESGLAIVGEKGAEAYRLPGGQWGITPAKPTVMDLPKGTEIITAEKTKEMLKAGALTGNISQREKENYYLHEAQKQVFEKVGASIVKAINQKNNKAPVVHFHGVKDIVKHKRQH